jgi:rod shape determining protein RodA
MIKLGASIAKLDFWLLVPTLYLLALSFVIQYSIRFKTIGVSVDYSLGPQIAAVCGAIAVAIVATYFRPKSWQGAFRFVFVLSIIFLLILAFTGGESVARWLQIGGLRFQPTEIVKLATIGVLAGYLAKVTAKSRGFKTIGISLVSCAEFLRLLIAVQPSLGSALVFAAIWSTMLLASPVKISKLTSVVMIFFMVLIFALPLLKPYQQDRISSFLNPTEDTQGSSYNTIQAGIAIGSGGFLGRGLDSGTQSQLNFLPAQHTDFAFAVTAEKLGLVGAISVILALAALMLRLSFLAWVTKNMYWRLILIGITGMFLFHALVNIGMNVGLLPVTGLPLPFISYGGTFLFVCLTSVLLAVILSYYIKLEDREEKLN